MKKRPSGKISVPHSASPEKDTVTIQTDAWICAKTQLTKKKEIHFKFLKLNYYCIFKDEINLKVEL